MPASGGVARLLVDAYAVEPPGAPLSEVEKGRRERQRISSRGIVDYKWDEQGHAILVPASGDLYLADAASGRVDRLTHTPGDESDARFSPKGRLHLLRARRAALRDGPGWPRGTSGESPGSGCSHLRHGGVRGPGGDGAVHRLLVVAGRSADRLDPGGRERRRPDPAPGDRRPGLHPLGGTLSARGPPQRQGRVVHLRRLGAGADQGRSRPGQRHLPGAGGLVQADGRTLYVQRETRDQSQAGPAGRRSGRPARAG